MMNKKKKNNDFFEEVQFSVYDFLSSEGKVPPDEYIIKFEKALKDIKKIDKNEAIDLIRELSEALRLKKEGKLN